MKQNSWKNLYTTGKLTKKNLKLKKKLKLIKEYVIITKHQNEKR